jgi:hypothetical protein
LSAGLALPWKVFETIRYLAGDQVLPGGPNDEEVPDPGPLEPRIRDFRKQSAELPRTSVVAGVRFELTTFR